MMRFVRVVFPTHPAAMPGYMAELVDKGVMHAVAAYRLFYGRR
ncbi:MAG: hypothetical protein ACM358_14440 [Gemmatimonadota bacterium]